MEYRFYIGNRGSYHNIPDNENACVGAQPSSLFDEYPINLLETKEFPHVSKSQDGFYTFDGRKAKISAPRNNKHEILKEEYINDLWIFTSLKGGIY